MPIIPESLVFTSGPANPGRQVDRSTGGQVWITHNPLLSYIYLRSCQHVYHPPGLTGPGQKWEVKLTGSEANLGEQEIIGNPYLFICRPVNMSTCLQGLTGSEVFIGEQDIMGIPYLTESEVNIGEQGIIFASGPVNLVDRSTG